MPEVDQVEINHRPKNEGLNHGQVLCYYQQPAAVQSIDDGAPDSAQKETGERLAKADEAEKEGGAGHRPNKPALGHRLHEVSCVGDDGAEEQESEIAVAE